MGRIQSLVSAALVAALITPVAAFAHDNDHRASGYGSQRHEHNGNCNHGEPPQYRPTRGGRYDNGRYDNGRYELRTTRQWVAGREDRVWVAEQCSYRERRWGRDRVRCVPGHYEARWVPATYQDVQQWVWVSLPGPVGVRVSFGGVF